MKTIFFLLAGLLLLATGCATIVGSRQSQLAVEPPVYLTGNNEPAAFAVSSRQSQPAVEPPVYYDGNDEPAASSGVVTYSNEQ